MWSSYQQKIVVVLMSVLPTAFGGCAATFSKAPVLKDRWASFQDKLTKKGRPIAPSSPTGSLSLTDNSPQEKTDPHRTRVDLLLAMAENHESHGNLSAAINAYEDVLKQEPNAQAFHRLGMLNYKQGDEEQAWQNLRRALKLAPGDADLLADAGYLKYISGDFSQAEELTRRALKNSSRDARLLNNLGLILVAQLRHGEALKAFLAGSSNRTSAYANLGNACLIMEQFPEAEKYLKIATSGEQPSSQAAESLALLQQYNTPPPPATIVRMASHAP